MADLDCRRCKDWRECPDKQQDGFLFAHIRFCAFQVLFILANGDYLHAGKWPPQYSAFEEPRKHQISEEGYFVKPALIIAEVEKRLETTNTQGKLLVAQCKAGESLEFLDDEAWEVLMYVKGWRRKGLSFQMWRKQIRYREKKLTTKK